jgi:hypothetical protein
MIAPLPAAALSESFPPGPLSARNTAMRRVSRLVQESAVMQQQGLSVAMRIASDFSDEDRVIAGGMRIHERAGELRYCALDCRNAAETGKDHFLERRIAGEMIGYRLLIGGKDTDAKDPRPP